MFTMFSRIGKGALVIASAAYATLALEANSRLVEFEAVAHAHAQTLLDRACYEYVTEAPMYRPLVEHDVVYARDLRDALESGFAGDYASLLTQERHGSEVRLRYHLDPAFRIRSIDESVSRLLQGAAEQRTSAFEQLIVELGMRDAPIQVRDACGVNDWIDATVF